MTAARTLPDVPRLEDYRFNRDRSTKHTAAYDIDSRTEPGVVHHLTLDMRAPLSLAAVSCSCKGWRRHRHCAHADNLVPWVELERLRRDYADCLDRRGIGWLLELEAREHVALADDPGAALRLRALEDTIRPHLEAELGAA